MSFTAVLLEEWGDSFRRRGGGVPGSLRTIFLVRILVAHDGATPEHHLVLGQRPRLVREDVLDLTQVLRDVEGPTLNGQIGLFIIQVKVVVQEEDLPELHQLNRHVQGDGDQHLQREGLRSQEQGGTLSQDPH